MTKEGRSEVTRAAALARWGRKRSEQLGPAMAERERALVTDRRPASGVRDALTARAQASALRQVLVLIQPGGLELNNTDVRAAAVELWTVVGQALADSASRRV